MYTSKQIFLEVRDYECDLQKVVNNSVYLNYMEHARHLYLKEEGINFAELTQKGLNLFVIRSEIDYKLPLKSGDEFYILTELQRESKLKLLFLHKIYRKTDNKLVCQGKIFGAGTDQLGRPLELENFGFNF